MYFAPVGSAVLGIARGASVGVLGSGLEMEKEVGQMVSHPSWWFEALVAVLAWRTALGVFGGAVVELVPPKMDRGTSWGRIGRSVTAQYRGWTQRWVCRQY